MARPSNHDSAIDRIRARARFIAAIALTATMLGVMFAGSLTAAMRPLISGRRADAGSAEVGGAAMSLEDDHVAQRILRTHPELAKLVEMCKDQPAAQAALAEFLRACQGLSREEIAEVFAREVIEIERMIN